MKIRSLAFFATAAGLSLWLHAAALASAEPAFGPGFWAVSEADPTGAPFNVGTWQAVADCGGGCLTVTSGDVSAKFTQQPDGTWTGTWHVVDDVCYDDFGATLPETATFTSNLVIHPDLTVSDHVVDEVGCYGGSGAYDATYTLTATGQRSSPDRITP
jgi:hypothetical protein